MNMISPLTIGECSFPVNIIQGPLAGISCAPFRRLTWEYSKPAFSCTEMMSCKTLLHQPKAAMRFLAKDPHEGPVCFQLSGHDPKELAEATQKATDHGADLIDLNCGCPVAKIRARGAGSRLLMNPARLYELIQAMKQHTHVPVSIKIRIDGQSTDQYNQEIATVVNESGVDFLVVHGRHWTEHYETPCQHDQIQFFVENTRVPVIGNGDISCISSLKKMLATGCHGVMIARAGVGQPWLIGQLIAEMQQKPFTLPTLAAIGSIFIEHVEGLAQLLQNEAFAIIQARKLTKYYARQLPNKMALIDEMNRCDTLSVFKQTCLNYFGLLD